MLPSSYKPKQAGEAVDAPLPGDDDSEYIIALEGEIQRVKEQLKKMEDDEELDDMMYDELVKQLDQVTTLVAEMKKEKQSDVLQLQRLQAELLVKETLLKAERERSEKLDQLLKVPSMPSGVSSGQKDSNNAQLRKQLAESNGS